MGPAVSLGDLDGRGGTGEAGHASLEGRNLRPRSSTTSVDARYTEFVRGSRLKSQKNTNIFKTALFFQPFCGNERNWIFRNLEFSGKFLEFRQKILEFSRKILEFRESY